MQHRSETFGGQSVTRSDQAPQRDRRTEVGRLAVQGETGASEPLGRKVAGRNYGISVMEAVQAGCPVVLTEDVYLAADLVAAGAAVFSPQEPEAAAEVIGGLLDDVERRSEMRAAAHRYTASTLGSDSVARQYSDLIAARR